MRPSENAHNCDCGGQCGSQPSRRDFLKLAGATTALTALGSSGTTAGEAPPIAPDHFVPVEKKLDPAWIKGLYAKGQAAVYGGDELNTIAMPIGGICAGQLYLAGDGRLMHWDIFNEVRFSGYGANNYRMGAKPVPLLDQGFALQVTVDGKTTTRTLDAKGFPGVRFCGEYPIGRVEYADNELPVAVTLEAFSPFIPLNAPDSALPATVMRFTVKNAGDKPAEVMLGGWLQNGVCLHSGGALYGVLLNERIQEKGLTMIVGSAKAAPPPKEVRPPRVLADFEGDDYGQWKAEGEAFGKGPAQGTLPSQQKVSGFRGKALVNTFLGGDNPQGKLTSPPFTIDRRFLSFLIGGGNQKGKTCINLLVGGKIVRTAVGKDNEKLEPCNWNVADLEGKEGHIEIIDQASGPWGHVNVDQIELRDTPMMGPPGSLERQPDFGTMGLAILDDKDVLARVSTGDPASKEMLADLFARKDGVPPNKVETPFGQKLCGAVVKRLSLKPGGQAAVTFVVAWCFPNRKEGNFYATRFADAAAMARFVAKDFERLSQQTRLWHDTWYDSTLPHWLLDRLFSTTSILATGTCLWWGNGRFWAWEGVCCCHGTCAHVWNYEHAMARLFPQLERSVREMQDYGAGFVEETGMVRFRGEGWGMWAGDSQPGTVLKAYREHQMSADGEFLKRNWPKIRKSLEFLFREDANDDGLIEGKQHNTYDIDFFGANTMVGSLYLAALRAGEEMAREMGDADFAARCRKIFDAGSRLTVEKLFNGEYFIQTVDLAKHPKFQYADGCLADQLFGQGWAHQVALGHVYPKDSVQAALKSIWKYNWAPDVGPHNKAHPPERWFARPGEAGLFTCTWPHSKHLGDNAVRYKDEIWTGIEYQVAGHMAWEGMVDEALAICRGVHDRYHPTKHNPWNEVECGDHYSRAMASHGVFLALCGFEYHGPKGHLGFVPRITPDDFRAAFTAAEGWGSLVQKRQSGKQTNRVEVRWGQLVLKTLAFDLPEGAKAKAAKVTMAGGPIQVTLKQDGRRVLLELAEAATVKEKQAIEVELTT
jgi:uncharacterized protein (DUF608 family)